MGKLRLVRKLNNRFPLYLANLYVLDINLTTTTIMIIMKIIMIMMIMMLIIIIIIIILKKSVALQLRRAKTD